MCFAISDTVQNSDWCVKCESEKKSVGRAMLTYRLRCAFHINSGCAGMIEETAVPCPYRDRL